VALAALQFCIFSNFFGVLASTIVFSMPYIHDHTKPND